MSSTAPSSHPSEVAAGRYRIRKLLGIGAKKRVYLAHDRDLDRVVALSLLRVDTLDAFAPRRILEEARAMARLGGHPRIVTIHDVGEEAGQPFVVSQYMAGGTLAERLRHSPHGLPVDEALRIAEELCQALEHAHAHGIIHRDLTPRSIWLDAEGFAKLGDFALPPASGPRRADDAGFAAPSPYVPPEQVLGRPFDARSDLYALGAVFYEMLTGQTPVLGRNHRPPPPSKLPPETDRALDDLILALLAESPEKRLPSAGAVRRSLLEIAATLRPAEPTSPDGRAPMPRAVFVGREQEIARLVQSLERAMAGHGRIVLVSGDPGIGKTLTAERLAAIARERGLSVLVARCHEGDGAPAYWPWVQILRAWIAEHRTEEIDRGIGRGASDIVQIIPELRDRLGDVGTAPAADLEAARFRMFDAITAFFKRACQDEPLVVILDDLHWADKPSLLLFQFLAREIADAPLLLLATYREADVTQGHSLAEILPALRPPLCERIALRGLAEEEVRELLAKLGERTIPPAFVRRIARETEGNPFFVQEILRHLIEEGVLFREADEWRSRLDPDGVGLPESVREVIGRRVRRLSDPCRRLLSVAAVIGREFDVRVLERAAKIEPEALRSALEEAETARVVARVARVVARCTFTHALIRETLYGDLGTTHRVTLHRRIGEVLEALHAPRLDPHLTAIAHHYFAAAPLGDADRAVAYCVRAGDWAFAQLAYEEATLHYRHALRAAELGGQLTAGARAELLLKIGETQWSAADFHDSKESFRRAADLAPSAEQMARAALGYGGLHPAFDLGISDQALVELLQKALERLSNEDSALRARVMVRLAEKLAYSPAHGPQIACAMAEEAAEMARRFGDAAALASVLSSLQFVAWRADNLECRAAWTREIIALADAVGDSRLGALGHLWRASQSLEVGDLEAAEPEFAALEECAREIRQPYIQWIAVTTRAMRSAIAGRLDEAEALAAEALAYGQERENRNASQLYGAQLLFLRWEQGRLAELVEAVAALADQYPELSVWRLALAWVLAELGLTARAAGELETLDRLPNAGVSADQFHLVSLWLLAETTARLGDSARARALYEKILPLRERCVMSAGCVFSGSISRSLGGLAMTLGRSAEAEMHFRDALAVHERMGARAFVARTRAELASLYLDRDEPGDRARGLDLVALALDEARRLQMRSVAEHALALQMRAQGVLPRQVAGSIDSVAASFEATQPNLAAQATPDGIVTLMLSDIEGAGSMTERLGDEEAYRVVKTHNALVRAAIAAHGGVEVVNQGDGFLVAFSAASRSLRCAVEVQRGIADWSRSHADRPILVRIGLHTGEPIREADRFFGKTVILAARIAAHARGGEILGSSVFRELVVGVEDIELGPLQEVELNGLAGRHRVCSIRWQQEPTAPPEPTAGRDASDNVFRRQTDHWEIRYGGKSVRLLDLKGMRDLANLLRHPGRELHVTELAALADEDETVPDALEPRATLSMERLRKAVGARIRESVARIAREHADLGRHLTNAVRTGTRCSYRSEKPVPWHF